MASLEEKREAAGNLAQKFGGEAPALLSGECISFRLYSSGGEFHRLTVTEGEAGVDKYGFESGKGLIRELLDDDDGRQWYRNAAWSNMRVKDRETLFTSQRLPKIALQFAAEAGPDLAAFLPVLMDGIEQFYVTQEGVFRPDEYKAALWEAIQEEKAKALKDAPPKKEPAPEIPEASAEEKLPDLQEALDGLEKTQKIFQGLA